MSFDHVYGQERVKSILAESKQRDRLAHAYLFHGPPGVGKDAVALAFARGLLCHNETLGGCGSCPSCQNMGNLEHPGFHFIMPTPTRPKSMKEDKYWEILRERALQRLQNPYKEVTFSPEISSSPVISIDAVRQMKKEVLLKLTGGGFRVFLVSHADVMTQPAANSLLKLLEEPPPKTILILTTSMTARLLSTIVSRCQSLRFDTLPEMVIQTALTDRFELPETNAAFFSRISGGSLQRALELSEQGFEEKREMALNFLAKSVNKDKLLSLQDNETILAQSDKQEIKEMLRILEVCVRDLFHLTCQEEQHLMNVDKSEELKRFLGQHPKFDAGAAQQHIEQSIDFIEKNVYLGLILHGLSQDLRACIKSS